MLMLKKILLAFALSCLVAFNTGCTNAQLVIQAQTANVIASSANALLPVMLERYNAEGMDELQKVKMAGGTIHDAREAIQRVKMKWKPIWQAWESLQIAHDKWATILESGGDTKKVLGELKTAYCELREVFPGDLPAIPLGVVKCKEKSDEQGSSGGSGPGLGNSEGGSGSAGSGRDRGNDRFDGLEGGSGDRVGRG